MDIITIRQTVTDNALRVAELGRWPSWIDAVASLAGRVPTDDRRAPGFDAGIACALDLIPRDKQSLPATLHAAYTPAAVEQVRREIRTLGPDAETCWWLAACSLCLEGAVGLTTFEKQIDLFKEYAATPVLRHFAAEREARKMIARFERRTYGVPFGTADGCMQGAYIAGHDFAAQFAESYGLYFIGTFRESLGLEEFAWSDEKDAQGRPMSGPVHGSRQFVKCANEDEFLRALAVVKAAFGA